MGRVLVLVLALGGCGPLVYVNDVTQGASNSVEAARVADADKYAPYYWTRAKEYLYKARERAAAADYQGANRFGRLAKEAAELAEQSAGEAKKDPSKRPLELKPEVAPAKGDAPIAPAKDAP
ncbi:MAG: DUF4398 domain-containing protein [Kofleriaceae bacterium]